MRERTPYDLAFFQELVREALDEFPERFQRLLDNLAVIVEDLASPDEASSVGVNDPWQILGLYHGVPYTQWGSGSSRLPDMIKIYRLPMLAVTRSPREIRKKVRAVILHELGHRAGLDEERLRELGVF